MGELHRICISGETTYKYKQIIELSNDELTKFRKDLGTARNKGYQAIDDFLGELNGDAEPIDWECNEWSAELINEDDSVIEYLDA